MRSITIEQLRAANEVGGVAGITLKGQGGAFLVQVATRSGAVAVLAKARSCEPRCFGNPVSALNVLRDIGITAGQFDIGEWDPAEKPESSGNRGRAEAMRKAHQAAAYSAWLAGELQQSTQDPSPGLSHDEVMAEMDAEIAALRSARNPSEKKRS